MAAKSAKPAETPYRKDQQKQAGAKVRRQHLVELVLAGKSTREIAATLNTAHDSIRNMLGEPAVKAAIDSMLAAQRESAERKLRRSAESVADALVEMALSSPNESVRLGAARDVLDRIGLTPQVKGTQVQAMISVVDGVKKTYGIHVAARIEDDSKGDDDE